VRCYNYVICGLLLVTYIRIIRSAGVSEVKCGTLVKNLEYCICGGVRKYIHVGIVPEGAVIRHASSLEY
jgi:hypothetical protein